jgi:hypothetical protein
MRKVSYDRERAEYIERYDKAERLENVWVIAGVIFYYKDGDIDSRFYRVYSGYMSEFGYNLEQVEAFCKSVKSGITCKTAYKYQRFCFDVFRTIARYKARFDSTEEAEEDLAKYMNDNDAPASNPVMILRAAFRELEHALISLPRTNREEDNK